MNCLLDYFKGIKNRKEFRFFYNGSRPTKIKENIRRKILNKIIFYMNTNNKIK